jgi:hypothetical protein
MLYGCKMQNDDAKSKALNNFLKFLILRCHFAF